MAGIGTVHLEWQLIAFCGYIQTVNNQPNLLLREREKLCR